MPHKEPYPDKSYSENVAESMKYFRIGGQAHSKVGNYMKVGAAICWLPWVLAISGLVPKMPSSVMWYSVGIGFSVIIWGFVRAGRKVSEHFSRCNQCSEKLRMKSYSGYEFYVCDRCKTYVRGRDCS